MAKSFHTVPIGDEIQSLLITNFKDAYQLRSVSWGKVKAFLNKQGIQKLNNYVPGLFIESVGVEGSDRNTENRYPFCISYVRAFQPGEEVEKVLITESETIAQTLLDHAGFRLLLNPATDGGQILKWDLPKIVYDNPTENFLRYVSANLTSSEIYIQFEVRNFGR